MRASPWRALAVTVLAAISVLFYCQPVNRPGSLGECGYVSILPINDIREYLEENLAETFGENKQPFEPEIIGCSESSDGGLHLVLKLVGQASDYIKRYPLTASERAAVAALAALDGALHLSESSSVRILVTLPVSAGVWIDAIDVSFDLPTDATSVAPDGILEACREGWINPDLH